MIKLPKQKILGIKPTTGRVLVQPNRKVDEINVADKKLYFDASFNTNENAPVTGTVISVCDRPYWNHNNAHYSIIDICPGDEIIFSYHEGSKYLHPVLEETILCEETNELFFFVQYSECYVAKRGNQVIALNHYHICEPIQKEFQYNIAVPEHLKKRNSMAVAKVLHCPERNTIYRKGVSPGHRAAPGQFIVFDANSDIPLEYDIHRSFLGKKEVFVIAQRDIVAVVENPDIIKN